MESDGDLFYDSLDEDFFSPKVVSDAPNEEEDEGGSPDVVTVPLYGGEVSRNDLSTKENKITKCKKCENSRSDYFVLDKDTKNSYLSLFRSRTKRKSNDQDTDTARATNGDVTERFSFCSGFTEGQHCCEFKDCVNDQSYDDCLYCESSRTYDANVSQISLETGVSEMSELKSVSQQHLVTSTRTGGQQQQQRRTPGRKPKTKIILSPILGSLGPNIDPKKLELLQKKQNYGLKVSQKNRIKFKEKQVLQSLQKEIENCRENRKKELMDDKKEPPQNTCSSPPISAPFYTPPSSSSSAVL